MPKSTTMLSCFIAILISPSAIEAQDPLQSLPDDDAAYIAKHLPGVVLGPVKGAAPISSTVKWFPLEATRFRYSRPGDGSKSVDLVLESTVRGPGSPIDSKGGGWSMKLPSGTRKYLSHHSAGGLLAPTAVSTANGFIIKLDPPEPIVLVDQPVSSPKQDHIDVKIYDIHDPTSVSYSGQVHADWTDLGMWKVKVPHGAHDARLVCLKFNGSIGPASVNARRYLFLVDGLGPVAFTDMRDISAFIFFSDDTRQAGVLEAVEPLSTPKKSKNSDSKTTGRPAKGSKGS
jgi:hypothetical protein